MATDGAEITDSDLADGAVAEQDDRGQVSSVRKALRLLECFSSEEKQVGLAELARRSGLKKTTAYRLLSTLVAAGWIERTADTQYRLTLRSFAIGSIALSGVDLREETHPLMLELADKLGLTVFLTVIDELRAVCLERIEGRQPVRILALDVGKSLPLTVGGGPMAMLAYRDDLIDRVLELGIHPMTENSVADETSLHARLAEVRERGYAVSREDITPGVCAIGAPVFDVSGTACAALSVSGLSASFAPPQDDVIAHHLTEMAAMASVRLGYRPRPS